MSELMRDMRLANEENHRLRLSLERVTGELKVANGLLDEVDAARRKLSTDCAERLPAHSDWKLYAQILGVMRDGIDAALARRQKNGGA